MDDARYWQLWGKTGPAGSWHPLLCHLLDVAAVASVLLDRHVSRAVLRAMAERVRVPEASFVRWVLLLVALHDLGKATPDFQRKREASIPELRSLGFALGLPGNQPHGRVTASELPAYLKEAGFTAELAWQAARWVGGHHGVFPSDEQTLGLEGLTGTGAWMDARAWLVAQVAALFDVKEAPSVEAVVADVGLWIAGLTSVADWIGSMEEYFPFASGPVDAAWYFGQSRKKAAGALASIGFRAWDAGEPRTFEDLFGFSPRPLQQTAIELSEGVDGPLFAIVEAPMGEGKTEAALWLGHELGRLAQHTGLYVALPTTATSNQMFQRVTRFLTESYQGTLGVQLLHGSAELAESFSRLRSVFDDDVRAGAGSVRRGTVVAEEWFTKRKRGLLSTFAVGTIDQALLGVLRTKHGFVRLYALAGKTVVLDEVHAYDAYTSRLLDRLVAWLRSLGASVILLSATLPSARRAQLLAAWGEHGEALAVPYPRVSASRQGKPWRRHIPPTSARAVRLRWQEGDLDGAVSFLSGVIQGGGCAGLICNTVNRAQAAWELVRAAAERGALPSDTEVLLIHARYTLRDRQTKERAVLSALGKPTSGARRPARALIIGTQVLEQSLDIDFDWLATDLAPVDLILQRTGRLWRHERQRPLACTAAELTVLLPPDSSADDGPDLRPHRYLYADAVLLRSWLALRRETSLRLPEDIERLIEEVYSDTPPEGLPAPFLRRLEEAQHKLEEERDLCERRAEMKLLAPPESTDDPFADFTHPLDEDDPDVAAALRAMTRLGGPSLTVVCLEQRGARLLALGTDHAVDLSETPNIALAKELMASSVPISSPAVVRVLRKLDQPPSWADSPFLRQARVLVLDAGVAILEGHAIRYDAEVGLTLSKSDAPGGDE